jgi:alpha-ribazole phosphatase
MESAICLIRHGLTEANKRRLYYGASDIPLSDEGTAQLRKLAAEGIYPRAVNADFYTTGLLRTEQTLSLIYGDVTYGTIPKLREMDFGEFEMHSYDELKTDSRYQAWITDSSGMTKTPSGESTAEFYTRVEEGFNELRNSHMMHAGRGPCEKAGHISVAVCHGGVISAIMQKLFPDEREHFYQWIPDPGHGFILRLQDSAIVKNESF